MRPPNAPPNQLQKPDDKDSPEYKKKVALHTLPLLETKDNASSYGMKESLFTSLKDIFESVVASQERTGVIRPHHFLDVLRREHEMFRTTMHQDAHEFLNLLLNEVVSNVEAEANRSSFEIDRGSETTSDQATTASTSAATTLTTSNGKTSNNTRWVHELFEGILTSETQCLTCEKVSQRDEVFLDLSVDLEQHSSVTACLRKFSAEEMLCERNKFHCDNCGGLQEAEKRMKIKRLPRILALHLKRFKYTEDLQRLQKLFHRVVYPYYLRLFNTTDDAEDPDRLYELYAVVVHIGGGPYHGHYVSIIKTEDRGWLLFDDEMVEPVDKNYVRNFFGDRPGLACAYVLFYQETTFEAMQREQEKEYMASQREAVELKDQAAASQKINGHTVATPDRTRGTVPPSPSTEIPPILPLKKTPSAPHIQVPDDANATALPQMLPPNHTHSKMPRIPLISRNTDVQSKKERAKEKEDRKLAEKEKEKAERQKRKDIVAKRKEVQKREDAEMKAAIEASKADDKHHVSSPSKPSKENGSAGKSTGGLNRLKIGSRSISYGRAFLKDKENSTNRNIPELPVSPRQVNSNGGQFQTNSHPQSMDKPGGFSQSLPPNAHATVASPPASGGLQSPRRAEPPPTPVSPTQTRPSDQFDQRVQPPKQATPKKSRFSLRKKSFSVL